MSPRQLLLEAYQAALDRCHGRAATSRALEAQGPVARLLMPGVFRAIKLLGAGKAAFPMAQAVEARLAGWSSFQGGVVVIKSGYNLPDASSASSKIRVREAAHPTPDERSVAAGSLLLAEAASLGPEDLLIFVLSGGASSLIEVPAEGHSLEELQQRSEALLRSGLPIEAINAERRRLSAIKGGKLAERTRASILTLILSDVPDAGPEVVGSGPTLTAFPPLDPRHHALVVADHRAALQQASFYLRSRGVEVFEETPGRLSRATAREHGAALANLWKFHTKQPRAWIWTGEAPVEVRGSGRGGRNQELALAAALALRGCRGVTVAVLATDGQDGSTDACGAIIDGETAGRIEASGLDPQRCLEENDAYPALHAAGALIPSRSTGTNVNDLCVVYVEPWASGGG